MTGIVSSVRSLASRALAAWRRSWMLQALLAVALAAAFVVQMHRLVRLEEWLDHTDRAISQALRLQKLVLDAETGIRGYLLTDDPQMLAPYRAQAREFDGVLAETRELVSDNAEQRARLDRFGATFREWGARARAFLDEPDADAARDRAYFGNGRGRTLIDGCRREIDAFLLREQALRVERSDALKSAVPRTIAGGAGLTLFLRLILGLCLRQLGSRGGPSGIGGRRRPA